MNILSSVLRQWYARFLLQPLSREHMTIQKLNHIYILMVTEVQHSAILTHNCPISVSLALAPLLKRTPGRVNHPHFIGVVTRSGGARSQLRSLRIYSTPTDDLFNRGICLKNRDRFDSCTLPFAHLSDLLLLVLVRNLSFCRATPP